MRDIALIDGPSSGSAKASASIVNPVTHISGKARRSAFAARACRAISPARCNDRVGFCHPMSCSPKATLITPFDMWGYGTTIPSISRLLQPQPLDQDVSRQPGPTNTSVDDEPHTPLRFNGQGIAC